MGIEERIEVDARRDRRTTSDEERGRRKRRQQTFTQVTALNSSLCGNHKAKSMKLYFMNSREEVIVPIPDAIRCIATANQQSLLITNSSEVVCEKKRIEPWRPPGKHHR